MKEKAFECPHTSYILLAVQFNLKLAFILFFTPDRRLAGRQPSGVSAGSKPGRRAWNSSADEFLPMPTNFCFFCVAPRVGRRGTHTPPVRLRMCSASESTYLLALLLALCAMAFVLLACCSVLLWHLNRALLLLASAYPLNFCVGFAPWCVVSQLLS